jgi:hypothetical protein
MSRSLMVGVCLLTALSFTPASASVVIAPSFDKLVADADAIVYAEVVERASRWERRGNRNVIVTDVTLRVREVLKGKSDAIRVVRVLGGTVGEVTQQVVGAPLFIVGDRDVLFLRRGAISPVVGLYHGRFRVVEGHNGSGEFVANFARQPITSVASYSRPDRLRAGERALALNDFIRIVRAAVQR